MAESMQDIKRRMKSVSSTEHITNAMKLVSASKFRKAKVTFDRTNEYLGYVINSISDVLENIDGILSNHVLTTREIKTTCYIVITGNRGLCGGFNSNVIKCAEGEIRNCKNESVLLTIGTKGTDYFKSRSYDVIREFEAPQEYVSFIEAKQIITPILNYYREGKIDEIKLIYTEFVNSMQQRVNSKVLLPLDLDKIDSESDEEKKWEQSEVEYDPKPREMLEYLLPQYVELELYKATIESNVCEHIARRSAMENATENARDMLDKLSLNYNRARQTAITNELIEIVSGSEALK